MSFDQIKCAVALLDQQQQAELISFTFQLRFAQDATFRREATDRLNDTEKSHWLTPDEFERRLEKN